MLRSTILISMTGMIFLLLIPPVHAGDYHRSITTTLTCIQCHTMHNSEGGVSMLYSGTGPVPYLLRATTVNELCLFCHDGGAGTGSTAPDVLNTAAYETSSLKRSAGFFEPNGTTNSNGHDIGVDFSGQSPPGYQGTWPPGSEPVWILTCTRCHDQHGNSNYRNLRTNPGNLSGISITYCNGCNDNSYSINQWVTTPSSTQYSADNMTFRSNTNQIAGFCKGCHSYFHGTGGDPNMGGPEPSAPWERHPAGSVSISTGNTNKHADLSYWQSALSSRIRVIDPDGTINSGDEMPFCLTCHKAHGSNRHSSLIFDDPSDGTSSEDGTYMRETCQQCHNQ